jgi:hypothetical protein
LVVVLLGYIIYIGFFSPFFEVKKLLTVANKIGCNFALVVIVIFENLSLIFNLIRMGAKNGERNIWERFVEIIPCGIV